MRHIKHKNKTLKKIHPKQLKFSILQFIFWATYAAYTPFIVVILQEKGFDNTVIGTILSINSFIVVLAQPFWGLISDWIRSVRKIFLLCFIIAIILYQTVPLMYSALFTGIILALFTVFESPLSPPWIAGLFKAFGRNNLSHTALSACGVPSVMLLSAWFFQKFLIIHR